MAHLNRQNFGWLVLFLLLAGLAGNQEIRTRRAEAFMAPQGQVVSYDKPWQPAGRRYTVGEDVFFTVARTSYVRSAKEWTGIVVHSGWQYVGPDENKKGLTYPCSDLPHQIKDASTKTITTVRTLHPRMIPGRYKLIGIVETMTPKAIPSVALFESEEIDVSPGPVQDGALSSP